MLKNSKFNFMDAEDLVEGEHFDVISFAVAIRGEGITPFDRHFDMDGEVLLDRERFERYNSVMNKIGGKILPLRRMDFKGARTFSPKNTEIGISHAIEVGFSVIKIRDHEDIDVRFRGMRMMVDLAGERVTDEELYDKVFLIRAGMYMQVTEEDVDFKWLESLIHDLGGCNRFIITSDGVMEEKLKESFAKKKVGKVIQFPSSI